MTDEDALEDLLGHARKARPTPSDALLARIEVDAAAEIAKHAAPPAARCSVWKTFSALGGWPAFASLTAAGVAGVWIGATDPAGVVSQSFGTAMITGLDATDPGYGYSEFAWGLE
ncbi:hypothetical protein [Ovoidimarina sediminis]|uniref:hypothetical protein n=1 Tax=Ovoidimarina sediminis TaxID=3079856 RepID=UPI00290BACE4|nr:hypothetical protein [Rhodophyticola sp. MJ-SS7]MDU8942127.1 hypothetical protein [Rhodophyticola sp. MJ-SS7]